MDELENVVPEVTEQPTDDKITIDALNELLEENKKTMQALREELTEVKKTNAKLLATYDTSKNNVSTEELLFTLGNKTKNRKV